MEDQPYPPSYLALVSTKVRLLSDYLLVNRDEVAKRQWVFLSLCIHDRRMATDASAEKVEES
jgi:hypothetical protein